MSYKIKPGQWLVQDISEAKGGISYNRKKGHKQDKGPGYEQEINSKKTVDHVAVVGESEQLIQRARYVLRACAVNTPFGWVADEIGVKRIREGFTAQSGEIYPGFDVLAQRAHELNERARYVGSERRTRIAFVPLRIEVDNEVAAREIARTVRDVCQDMIDVLRAGEPKKLANILATKAQNLSRLATGMQKQSIDWAIERAKEVRSELLKARKGQPEKVHQQLMERAGKAADLEAIEACIEMFRDYDEDEDSASGAAHLAVV